MPTNFQGSMCLPRTVRGPHGWPEDKHRKPAKRNHRQQNPPRAFPHRPPALSNPLPHTTHSPNFGRGGLA